MSAFSDRISNLMSKQKITQKQLAEKAREALIKSGMQIAQADFSSGGCRPQDCMKMTQEYLMYFKEFSCNHAENMQARCVPRFILCFPRLQRSICRLCL